MPNLPPSVQLEETADGTCYTLPQRESSGATRGLAVFGAVFGGFALLWMVMALTITFAADNAFAQICFPAFGLPFLAVGGGMFVYGMGMSRSQAIIEITADSLVVTDGWGPLRRSRKRPKQMIAALSVRSHLATQTAGGCLIEAKTAKNGSFRFAKGYSQGLLVPVAEDLLTKLEVAPSAGTDAPRVSVMVSTAGMPHVPEPRPRDVVLSRAASGMGGLALLVFAIVWNGIVGVVGSILFMQDGVGSWPLLIVSVFGVVGLLILAGSIHKLLAQSRIHPPVIALSTSPVLLGESVTGRFSQTPKRGIKINKISVKIICRESATYTHGTNTSTVTHDVSVEEHILLENQHASPLQPLEGDFSINISDDAMHSFSANRNSIQWLIEMHTDIAGWPDYKHAVKFDVAAQRVPLVERNQEHGSHGEGN
ncbi:MAG: hypothetical protein MPJ50_13435 [Pirellulales bacterium]|nr:hypothetical protein [Pirellulales bacterium]